MIIERFARKIFTWNGILLYFCNLCIDIVLLTTKLTNKIKMNFAD